MREPRVIHVSWPDVQAARLRLATDRKQGKRSSLWIAKLAKAKRLSEAEDG